MKIEQLLEEYFNQFTSYGGKNKATLFDFYLWLKDRNGS